MSLVITGALILFIRYKTKTIRPPVLDFTVIAVAVGTILAGLLRLFS